MSNVSVSGVVCDAACILLCKNWRHHQM